MTVQKLTEIRYRHTNGKGDLKAFQLAFDTGSEEGLMTSPLFKQTYGANSSDEVLVDALTIYYKVQENKDEY